MNRLVMCSTERTSKSILKLKPAIPAELIYQDEVGSNEETTFLSAPNGDPLMAFWSEDFEEWSVYYSE